MVRFRALRGRCEGSRVMRYPRLKSSLLTLKASVRVSTNTHAHWLQLWKWTPVPRKLALHARCYEAHLTSKLLNGHVLGETISLSPAPTLHRRQSFARRLQVDLLLRSGDHCYRETDNDRQAPSMAIRAFLTTGASFSTRPGQSTRGNMPPGKPNARNTIISGIDRLSYFGLNKSGYWSWILFQFARQGK